MKTRTDIPPTTLLGSLGASAVFWWLAWCLV